MQKNRFKHEIEAEGVNNLKDALYSFALLVSIAVVLLAASFKF